MNNILKESLLALKRQKIITSLLFVQLVVSFTLIIIFTSAEFSISQSKNEFENHLKDNVYQLSDIAYDNEINEYLHNPSSLDNLKSFYNSIENSKNYIYLVKNSQMCLLDNFLGDDIFRYGYEDGYANPSYKSDDTVCTEVKAYQLNYQSISYYQLSVEDGNLLKEENMIFNGENVPVMLGADYKGFYDIGEKISGSYLKSRYTFIVVGILKANSAIVDSNALQYLDRYIIMPSLIWNELPESVEENFTQGATYVNKVNGEVVLNDDYTLVDFVKYLENCRLSHGIGFDFTVLSQNMITLSIIKSSVYESASYIIVISIIIVVLAMISTYYAIHFKISRNLKKYSILTICGYTNREIITIIFLEFVILIVSAMITSFLLGVMIMGPFIHIRYMIPPMIIAIFSLCFFTININKKDLIVESKRGL